VERPRPGGDPCCDDVPLTPGACSRHVLAVAPQTACGSMHELASIHRHREALESRRPHEVDKTSRPLQAARDPLRELAQGRVASR